MGIDSIDCIGVHPLNSGVRQEALKLQLGLLGADTDGFHGAAAGRTALRHRSGMTAMVTHQPFIGAVIGQSCAAAAKEIMKRLKFDNKTISDVTTLIYFHSEDIESDADIKKLLSKLGEELFFALLDVKRADNSAKNDFVLEELSEIDEIEKNARRIITSGECYSLRQLAVNGNDLAEIGITGINAGVTLNTLLNLVIEGKTENTRSELISAALEILRKG